MKYTRLTKEQFEALHLEFSRFLATQQITAAQWSDLKENSQQIVEQELDVFSELIWEGVLGKVTYLEKIEKNTLHLFHADHSIFKMVSVRVDDNTVDFYTEEGFKWLEQHFASEKVHVYRANKHYSEDKNLDIFDLITKGAVISDGKLYQQIIAAVGDQ